MAVVASVSAVLSKPMPEAIARAIAKQTTLFGYRPEVGDHRRGGFELTMFSQRDVELVNGMADEYAANGIPA